MEFVDQLPGGDYRVWESFVSNLLEQEGRWAIVTEAADKAGATKKQRGLFPRCQPYIPAGKRLNTAVRGTTVYARIIPRGSLDMR